MRYKHTSLCCHADVRRGGVTHALLAHSTSSRAAMSHYPAITPAQVLEMDGPTTGFMCPLSANTYGIDFIDFEIKDGETNKSLFRVQKDPNAPSLPMDMPDLDPETEASYRTIKYNFPPEFLNFQSVR